MKYKYEKKYLSQAVREDQFVATLDPAVQEFLAGRGFDNAQEIQQLFRGNIQDILQNLPMQDSEKAISLLTQALERGDKMAVYRDYDCDGCCAVAVAVESLACLGAQVFHYGNQRSVDGYGICVNGIKRILEFCPELKLIITVDNGIVAYEAIEFAKSQGLTVIVTDHHEMGENLPTADAVVDPKRRDEFADFHELCGAGVIFKLMLGLYQALNRDITPVLRTLDLVAMATVGDIVPLVGENRILAKEGIALMNQGARPFFREVMKQQGLKKISAHSELGFRIVPMINAPSRMNGDVNMAVSAMMQGPGEKLETAVSYLKTLNDTRKTETEQAQRMATAELKKLNLDFDRCSTILLLCPDINDGLVGLVAGRMMNQYHKIVGVFHENDQGMLKGSFRGLDGFHIKEALDQVSPGILSQYGGHSKAAGLSLKKENFQDFAKEFTEIVENAFPDGIGEQGVFVDVSLLESDCSLSLVETFSALEPYGEGFRPPLFELSLPEHTVRFMGNEKQHVAYVGKDGIRAIRWRFGENERENPNETGLFYGNLDINHWNGRDSVQFICQ